MSFTKFGQKFLKFGVFAVSASLLLTSGNKAIAESTRSDRRLCSREGLVESFYVETATFFANICRDSSSNLTYIGGPKDNPENATTLPAIAEEGIGYVADSEDVMLTITGVSVEIFGKTNGRRILDEEVIYYCSESGCEDR